MSKVEQEKNYQSPSIGTVVFHCEGVLAASCKEPMEAVNDGYVLDIDKFEF